MVEKVARAICAADWGGVSDAEMDRCRSLARAAILAMREPTPEMVIGVNDYVGQSKTLDGADGWDWLVLHKVAIDAALKG